MGLMPKHKDIYSHLSKSGFTLVYPVRECPAACLGVHFSPMSTGFNAPCEFSNGVYKEAVYDGDGRAEGNCDADLITQVMQDSYENKKAPGRNVSMQGSFL